MRTKRRAAVALLGTVIVLSGCSSAAAKTAIAPSGTPATTVAPTTTKAPPPSATKPITTTTTPAPTTTTSTTLPSASFTSISSDLQKLVRFGALPNAAAVPDAVVNCPTAIVETGGYFACNIDSQSLGNVMFIGKITNARAGTFEEITLGSALTCSSLNSGELAALDAIGKCAPMVAGAPTMSINGVSVTEPTVIGFSADAGNIASNLVWTGWGNGTAYAQGTVGLENCNPDCADGSVLNVPAAISVTDLYGGTYHSITETVQGQTPQTDPMPYSS